MRYRIYHCCSRWIWDEEKQQKDVQRRPEEESIVKCSEERFQWFFVRELLSFGTNAIVLAMFGSEYISYEREKERDTHTARENSTHLLGHSCCCLCFSVNNFVFVVISSCLMLFLVLFFSTIGIFQLCVYVCYFFFRNLNSEPLFSIVNQIKSYVNELHSVEGNVSCENILFRCLIVSNEHCMERTIIPYTCLGRLLFFSLHFCSFQLSRLFHSFHLVWRWNCNRKLFLLCLIIVVASMYAFLYNGWSVIAVVIIEDRSKVYK